MCTEVSQQSDVESSLNGVNELRHPELTGQRKQQGQEAPEGAPLPRKPPPPQASCLWAHQELP